MPDATGKYQWIEKPSRQKSRADYTGLEQPKAHEIRDEALLEKLRSQHTCDVCGKWFDRLQPHHVVKRSFLRMDLFWNLLSVCPKCHVLCGEKFIPDEVQHAIAIAKRRGEQ